MQNEIFKNILICLIALGLVSCGKNKPKTYETPQHLIDRAEMYCNLSYEKYKQRRHVHHRCDASGFTALYSVACPHLEVDLSVFSDSTGKMHRDPDHSCFINGEDNGSKSESSKDMTIMRMFAAWRQKDLAWVESFYNFAKSNNFVFCDAIDTTTKLGRCVLSWDLILLLRDMRNKLKDLPTQHTVEETDNEAPFGLSEDSYKSEDSVWDDFTKEFDRRGFRSHLHVLKINLKGEIYGHISNSNLRALKKYAQREPKNGLYNKAWAKWGDGSLKHVYFLLGDETHWPVDRLPNNHLNHCTKYLYQRDEYKPDGSFNSDWAACPEKDLDEHPATEFGLTVRM